MTFSGYFGTSRSEERVGHKAFFPPFFCSLKSAGHFSNAKVVAALDTGRVLLLVIA